MGVDEERLNEEEVKQRILLPYLERLGLQKEELKFETSFCVRVGRNELVVGSQRGSALARGRLDVLISQRGRNHFVVEVKAESHSLDRNDRDQAISYARLVHPVAPFALVTNGKEWQLFDALTKQEVRDEDLKLGEFEISLPDDLRAEALRHFLGLSAPNLQRFCTKQVDKGTKPLRGSVQDRHKKYIPELHVRRSEFHRTVESFLSGDKNVLALTSQSGSGKTSSLCRLALEMIESERPVLFYRGIDIVKGGILETVADELGFTFRESYSHPAHLLRQLESALGETSPLVIVDAIDEWPDPSAATALNQLAKRLEGSTFKLVFSCKSTTWPKFCYYRGDELGILHYIYERQEVHLPPFSLDELYEAVGKYRDFYDFRGVIEERVWDEMMNRPFLMRVFFEVAETKNLKQMSFSHRVFFEDYFIKVTERTTNPVRARALLCKVAEALLDAGSDYLPLRQLDNLFTADPLDEVVDFQILDRTQHGDEDLIGFYFSLLRDYLVAFKVLRWPQLRASAFKAQIETLGPIASEALFFYYPHATAEHQRALDHHHYAAASKYLNVYDEILRKHLPTLRRKFPPETDGRIGFIGEIIAPEGRLGTYGFRAMPRGKDNSVAFVLARAIGRYDDLRYLHGGRNLRSNHDTLEFPSNDALVSEVLRQEVNPQLRELIEAGKLDEAATPDLAIEAVASMVASHPKIFRRQGGGASAFPINLREVNIDLQREIFRGHFESVRTDQLIQQGTIGVHQGPLNLSWYRRDFGPEDLDWIDRKAEEAVRGDWNMIQLQSESQELEELKRRFQEADRVLSSSRPVIKEALLPKRNWLWQSFYQGPVVDDAPFLDELFQYVEDILRRSLENYVNLIKHNFPTSSMLLVEKYDRPLTVICGVDLEGHLDSRRIRLAFFEGNGQKDNIRYIVGPASAIFQHEDLSEAFRREVLMLRDFFEPWEGYTGFKIKEEHPVIRHLVYSRLESLTDSILEKLAKRCGLPGIVR